MKTVIGKMLHIWIQYFSLFHPLFPVIRSWPRLKHPNLQTALTTKFWTLLRLLILQYLFDPYSLESWGSWYFISHSLPLSTSNLPQLSPCWWTLTTLAHLYWPSEKGSPLGANQRAVWSAVGWHKNQHT